MKAQDTEPRETRRAPLSAVVLAAGRSTRMGRDKALLEREGKLLWQRQRDVLRGAGATELLLSARPEQAWVANQEGFDGVLYDAFPDCGPIMGVTAGLERMTQLHLAVLAIDLPEMTSEWFTLLMHEASASVGVVGRCEGYFEPLAAVYPRELKWLAWETIARGEYSLQVLLAAAVDQGLMRLHEIDDGEARWFRNWNER